MEKYGILRNKLYIPIELVTKSMLNSYTTTLLDYYPENETDDRGNPILDENHNVIPRLNRDLVLKHYLVGKSFVGFNRGDVGKLKKVFQDFKIYDETSKVKYDNVITFLGHKNENGEFDDLYEEQKTAIATMKSHMYGIMDCNPRFGKTLCACKIICDTGMKTLVIVNQESLAQQFIDEFLEDTDANLNVIGKASSLDDFNKYDICVSLWQKLYRNPNLVNSIKRMFGLLIVDEAHSFASKCSHRVIDKLWSQYKIGLTATPERKDALESVVYNILGPVTVIGRTKQVPLIVHTIFTHYCPEFSAWTTYISKIARQKTRNKLIVDNICEDVKQGHKVILACTLIRHMETLREMLLENKLSVVIFNGRLKPEEKKQVLMDARLGKYDVVIAQQRMLEGINVPCWDSIHLAVPTSNKQKFYQVFARVRTPTEDKKYALVYDYLDACGASNGAYHNRHITYKNKDYSPIYYSEDLENHEYIKFPSFQYITKKAEEGNIYGDGCTRKSVNNWRGIPYNR